MKTKIFRLEQTFMTIVEANIFWGMMPCIFVDVPLMIGAVPPKLRYIYIKLSDVTSQKADIFNP
jgi:hypothetical protein